MYTLTADQLVDSAFTSFAPVEYALKVRFLYYQICHHCTCDYCLSKVNNTWCLSPLFCNRIEEARYIFVDETGIHGIHPIKLVSYCPSHDSVKPCKLILMVSRLQCDFNNHRVH